MKNWNIKNSGKCLACRLCWSLFSVLELYLYEKIATLLWFFKTSQIFNECQCCKSLKSLWTKKKFPIKAKKKNALVSGNAGDEKNLHPDGRKLIFLNWFSGDIFFSSLVYFTFFVFLFVCLFVCLFLEIKNIYFHTHWTMRVY